MHTPDEAIEVLEHAVNELGLKAVYMNSLIERPIEEPDANMVANGGYWFDVLGLDSAYDYDPVWQKCVDLKVPVTAHAVSQGIGMRRSKSITPRLRMFETSSPMPSATTAPGIRCLRA